MNKQLQLIHEKAMYIVGGETTAFKQRDELEAALAPFVNKSTNGND